MIKNIIKKVLVRRQAKQELVQRLRRQAQNKEQIQLILQGLQERGL